MFNFFYSIGTGIVSIFIAITSVFSPPSTPNQELSVSQPVEVVKTNETLATTTEVSVNDNEVTKKTAAVNSNGSPKNLSVSQLEPVPTVKTIAPSVTQSAKTAPTKLNIDVRPLPQENKNEWVFSKPLCYNPKIAMAMAPKKYYKLVDANRNGLQLDMIIDNCKETPLKFEKINYTVIISDYIDDNLTILNTGLEKGGIINPGATSTVGINFSGITHTGLLTIKVNSIDSKINGENTSYEGIPQSFEFFIEK